MTRTSNSRGWPSSRSWPPTTRPPSPSKTCSPSTARSHRPRQRDLVLIPQHDGAHHRLGAFHDLAHWFAPLAAVAHGTLCAVLGTAQFPGMAAVHGTAVARGPAAAAVRDWFTTPWASAFHDRQGRCPRPPFRAQESRSDISDPPLHPSVAAEVATLERAVASPRWSSPPACCSVGGLSAVGEQRSAVTAGEELQHPGTHAGEDHATATAVKRPQWCLAPRGCAADAMCWPA